MIYTPLTKLAMNIALEKHYHQKDKAGYPYMLHIFKVADPLDDEISCAVGLLHDVVEDTGTTFDDLLKLGIPEEVIEVLKLVTHDPNIPYLDYVKNLLPNPYARKVKKSDLTNNMDLHRLDEITPHDLERLERYKKAMKMIEDYEKEHK